MTQSWVKWTSMYNLTIQNSCANYLPSDISTILFTDEKIFSHHTDKKLAEWPTVHQSRWKTLRQNVCGVSDSTSRRVTSGWHCTSLTHLSITESRLARSINPNVMLLQQFLPAIPYVRSEASSSSFSRTVPRRIRRLRQSNFPHYLAKFWAIIKILSKRSAIAANM